MPKHEVTLVEMEKTVVFGRGMDSSDRSQHEDIPFLSRSFTDNAGFAPGDALPFYVVSSAYNKKKHTFHLFIGGLQDAPALQAFVLPKGTWAKITIRPRFKKLWGGVMGNAKRWFYESWLPKSGYAAESIEYEYHTEATFGEDPTAELYFALRKKEAAELL